MRVVDVMTSDVITVRASTSITDAARLMFRNRISGLPVCDADSCLIGMITEADFLRLEVDRHADGEMSTVETVGEVMTQNVMTIDPAAELSDVAAVMVKEDINRLPVVDADSRMLGIISRLDVVAAFTRPDDVIEDEIREDVLRRLMRVDLDSIDVKVDAGIVTFNGTIDTRAEAALLEELVRRLDGVLRVENRLIWSPTE
ncbi:MAG: CBS domain-containing protein [Acidimicrobiia bacterium]|nr:CBS domain-containing protein [Acidimicrobiia bacterium]